MKLDRSQHKVSMPVTDYELIINNNYEKSLYDDAFKALLSFFLPSNLNLETLSKHFREKHNIELELTVKYPTGGVDKEGEIIIKTLRYIKPPKK